MGRLIDADKLILHLNDWGLAISPDERTPDIVKEYTAKDMSKMEYRTIQTAMLVIEETPTVEAIPKDQYEARLKADMVAMLTEILLEIEEEKWALSNFDDIANDYVVDLEDVDRIIQEKINSLKENNDNNNN